MAAQISPGPLSRAHQDLSGPAGCTKCHAITVGTPAFVCLDCHEEIRIRLRDKRGLHPKLLDSSQHTQRCVGCHSEHNGADFALIKWDTRSFDHAKTGFRLEGKHASLNCRQCHNAQKVQPAERATIRMKDLNRTYLGLSATCTSCHEDKHHGQLGDKCASCHNQNDWKVGPTFNHARTRFPLLGAHLQVTCQKCHTAEAGGRMRLTGLRFAHCVDCHRDPHGGEFREQACESCHTVNAWKPSTFLARFDHSKTKFALAGKHVGLSCQSCHHGSDFARPMAYQKCADCHKDAHNGQFLSRADGGRCESCHTVNGFKQATFTVKEHASSLFPLRGRHAVLECKQCHKPEGAVTVFKIKAFGLCSDCHRDAHGGQFALAPYDNRCERCHDESGFHPSTFTLARHQQTRFPLTGGHVATPCIACHQPVEKPRLAAYHFSRIDCTSCHRDPHQNQFAARMARVNAGGRAAGCEACHSTAAWSELSRFDHSGSGFELTGAHRSVECSACHRPPNLERTLQHVDFKAAPQECEACHEDPHGGQFARAGVTRCAGCHTTTKWKPALFDHEKTKFSLAGAHQQVRCSACHLRLQQVNGRPVLFYAPTPTACASCHAAKVARSR